MEQSNISRHLAILKREGILSSRKEGLKVIYRVPDPRVFQILELSREMLRYHLKEKSRAVRERLQYNSLARKGKYKGVGQTREHEKILTAYALKQLSLPILAANGV